MSVYSYRGIYGICSYCESAGITSHLQVSKRYFVHTTDNVRAVSRVYTLTALIVIVKLILIRSRQMTRSQKKSQLEECLQGLTVDDEGEESEAECPKCGLVYGEDNSVWIQCDSCGLWYDLKCTNVNHDNIPEAFSCEICC